LAGDYAGVPSGNWLTVAISLEEFGPANHLGIFSVANFEPSASFSIFLVTPRLMFGNNAFKI
jgi:hypothetical protein